MRGQFWLSRLRVHSIRLARCVGSGGSTKSRAHLQNGSAPKLAAEIWAHASAVLQAKLVTPAGDLQRTTEGYATARAHVMNVRIEAAFRWQTRCTM